MDQRAQAAVESAIVLPLMLFNLLGALQLTLAYQARLATEYAAFKAARAASVYRLDCGHMTRAALVALAPTLDNTASTQGDVEGVQERYLRAISEAIARDGNVTRVGTPRLVLDFALTRRLPEGAFDSPLAPGEAPMKVRLRLHYFYEYRIPFANWLMARYWLAVHRMKAWSGVDPLAPTRQLDAAALPPPGAVDPVLLDIASRDFDRRYMTAPIEATWSMRMMSDPLPSAPSSGRCGVP